MLREGRAGLLLLSVCALSLLNATAPLNPTVKVVKHPAKALPPECDEGVAPPPSPRIQVAEAPPEPVPVAAHPATVRDLLQETQAAAARGDREGFNDAFARVKPLADRDVVRVYDDLNRLWTYEFESPTGAFFNSSNELLSMLNAYPGYQKAIEEQTITVGGTKLYPSRESRDFLVREAASRLAKLGFAKKPVVATTTTATTKPTTTKPKPAPREKPRTTTVVVHHKKSSGGRAPTPVPVTKVAETKPKPKPVQAPVPVPAPVPKPAPAPQPAPVPAPVPTTTTQAPVATTTTAPPPVTTTTATPTPAPATDTTPTTATQQPSTPATAEPTTTTATTTTATETTATETTQPQPQKSPMKNVILPIILIVIGVGVLIVLFRASS